MFDLVKLGLVVLQIASMGASAYAAANPEYAWLGPIATVIAGVTKSPQRAIGEMRSESTTGIMKGFIIAWCVFCTFKAYQVI